jgi:hypothetical protein
MSIAGFLRTRGDRCHVVRVSETRAADRTVTHTHALHARDLRLRVREVSAERAQRLWGLETKARFTILCPPNVTIRIGDYVVPREGAFAGETFRVGARDRAAGARRVLFAAELASPAETTSVATVLP